MAINDGFMDDIESTHGHFVAFIYAESGLRREFPGGDQADHDIRMKRSIVDGRYPGTWITADGREETTGAVSQVIVKTNPYSREELGAFGIAYLRRLATAVKVDTTNKGSEELVDLLLPHGVSADTLRQS